MAKNRYRYWILERLAKGKSAEWWQAKLVDHLVTESESFGLDSARTQNARAVLAKHLETNEVFLEARRLRLENLESFRRSCGENDLNTAFAYQALANNFGLTGEYEKAEGNLQRVYDIRFRILGDSHNETIFALDQLARAKAFRNDETG